MKILPITLILIVLRIQIIFCQSKIENTYFDVFNNKPVTFGFSIGMSLLTTNLENNTAGTYKLPVFEVITSPGFSANFIASLKLSELFDLRFTPGLSYFGRTVNHTAFYSYGTVQKAYNISNLPTSLVELPLHLIYKMTPKNDRRFVVGLGAKYDYNLAWENNPIELERVIYKNASDFQIDALIGYQIFTKGILITPEFKVSKGSGKILTYQNKSVLSDTYFIENPFYFSLSLGFIFN